MMFRKAILSVGLLLLGSTPLALAQTYTVLYNFTGGSDGANSLAPLLLSNGYLYGTTQIGGDAACDAPYGCGTVFKLDKETGQETVLYRFRGGPDGAQPEAGLAMDSAGNLYGTTNEGGGHDNCFTTHVGCGTVFKLDTNGDETVLYSFSGGADGANPYGELVLDSAGNLYGTTLFGGASDQGTVFKLGTTGTETVLHAFSGTDGANPWEQLLVDSAGNLYGVTEFGGAFNQGTVFKVDTSGTETVLHSFSDSTHGRNPQGGLQMDSAGNLYGTTGLGGTLGGGTLFELTTGGREHVLHSFIVLGGSDGSIPAGGLAPDGKGNFYGATIRGGSTSGGTVFVVDRNGREKVLHNFGILPDGSQPFGGVIRDAAGNLYGTTYFGGTHGGSYGDGVVFKLAP